MFNIPVPPGHTFLTVSYFFPQHLTSEAMIADLNNDHSWCSHSFVIRETHVSPDYMFTTSPTIKAQHLKHKTIIKSKNMGITELVIQFYRNVW